MTLRLFVTAVIAVVALAATAQRTTRRNLKVQPQHIEATKPPTPSPDTLADLSARRAVALAGYSKTLRSRTESIYATNRLGADSLIVSVVLDIEYTDASGRQLHRRTVKVDVPGGIPPGQTRLLTFPSFDRQFTMYYRRGPAPRTKSIVYPFDVTITPVEVLLAPTADKQP